MGLVGGGWKGQKETASNPLAGSWKVGKGQPANSAAKALNREGNVKESGMFGECVGTFNGELTNC